MFDESIFMWALLTRPEDARRFSQVFKPEWLLTVEYRPILQEVYKFLYKHRVPPDLPVLHTIFSERDPMYYTARIKGALDTIAEAPPSVPEMLYTLDKARDVAIVRCFQGLVSDPRIVKAEADLEGSQILTDTYKFINLFATIHDEETKSIKEAVEQLVKDYSFDLKQREKVPVGIQCIDQWTFGGLRPAQLGIIMGVSGHGKSSCLANIAYNVASGGDAPVWFITNELTMAEQTERLLSRMTGKSLSAISEDPVIAYHDAGKHWAYGMENNLLLTSLNKEVSTDDLESTMTKWINIRGFKPKVIVLDFMERMKPNDSGYKRDKEWHWLGAIAKDLIQLAKRHNLLVWTAAQTNREGFSAKLLDMTMVQGSTRHLQEASAVIGMKQIQLPPKDGEERTALEFFNLKMRHAKKAGRPVALEVDFDTMYITDKVVDIIEAEQPEEDDTHDDYRFKPRQTAGKRRTKN